MHTHLIDVIRKHEIADVIASVSQFDVENNNLHFMASLWLNLQWQF